MRKKMRFWAGMAAGAAIQYFYDPKAGASRRAMLRERLMARVLEAKDRVVGKETGIGNIDHIRMWRSESGRTASRSF